MDVTQIQLPSGRGVRYRMLKPSELDKALALAAKGMTPDTTMVELRQAEARYGMDKFIVQVTRECLPLLSAEAMEARAKGQQLTDEEHPTLSDPKSWIAYEPSVTEDVYDKFFTAPDHQVLIEVFQQLHNPRRGTVDRILGKSKTVVL